MATIYILKFVIQVQCNVPLIRRVKLLEVVPVEFDASARYTPLSSGNTSAIIKRCSSPDCSYLKSSDSRITSLPLYQVISGLPGKKIYIEHVLHNNLISV